MPLSGGDRDEPPVVREPNEDYGASVDVAFGTLPPTRIASTNMR
jgi:hypothetical protein